MSWEALRILWTRVKEGGVKTSCNDFPITLSSGWQVKAFTTLSFIILLSPKVKYIKNALFFKKSILWKTNLKQRMPPFQSHSDTQQI